MSKKFTEQRPWGHYTILDEGHNYKVKRLVIEPEQRISLQWHKHRTEYWTVLAGNPTITKHEEIKVYEPGESVVIPAKALHRVQNKTEADVVIIEIQKGEYLEEDDIIRVDDDYKREAKPKTSADNL